VSIFTYVMRHALKNGPAGYITGYNVQMRQSAQRLHKVLSTEWPESKRMTQLRRPSKRQKFLPELQFVQDSAHSERVRGDKKLKKRADDLAWQMNFAKMKLNHWHDLDNLDWESLEELMKTAKAGYQKLNSYG